MKFSNFSAAMLIATAAAHGHGRSHERHNEHHHEAQTSQSEMTYTSKTFNEHIVEGFKAWNCMTCKMAFSAIDRFLLNDKFDSMVHSVSSKICEFHDLVPDDMDVCPLMTEHYEMSLLTAVSKYMLSGQHMCNEVMGLCKAP